jgi:hypothetical protein
MDAIGRRAVELAVVALAQARVLHEREPRCTERDFGGLDGASQVGAEDDIDTVVQAPLAKLAGQLAPTRRQLAREPACGDADLVVGADGVRLEDDADGDTTSSPPPSPVPAR